MVIIHGSPQLPLSHSIPISPSPVHAMHLVHPGGLPEFQNVSLSSNLKFPFLSFSTEPNLPLNPTPTPNSTRN